MGPHPFTVITAPQGSPAWLQARLGRLTGSRAKDMLAEIKTKGEAAARRHLRTQLVLERVTGRSQAPDFVSAAMQQGLDREADAYAAYQALTGELLTRTGFLSHKTLAVGCSLDGHVGDYQSLIEIKSPMAATHLDYLKTGRVPLDYHRQILHALWLTGAEFCDWMSFNPDFPGVLQAKIVRVTRNELEIGAYAAAVAKFLAEVEMDVALVRALEAA